ncbi:MAG: suppressor of fused domain protein [Archangium sp.]|nr:suppressor of fused domain protein [Archangium sp.]MDP3155445.1 suppressor of fused domain protein [Archangium sp.]MDP3573777.1 suppressor of fused domain protein [Archangium sp.]
MFGWFGKKKERAPTSAAQWIVEAQWAARSRWISHVVDFLGDPSNEWKPNPGMELPNRPEFLVLEFAPRAGRDHYTYLTAGLSLVPQTPSGSAPHVEFIAYSQSSEPRIAQFLFMLSHDVASAGVDERAFNAFDLWGAEFFGLRDFVLVPAREEAALLDFPNLSKRMEDQRYLLAATGDLNGKMSLNVLQLVPLTHDQWLAAREQGSQTLLNQSKWETQPKTSGWSAMQG